MQNFIIQPKLNQKPLNQNKMEEETWCAFDDLELTAELAEIGSDLY